MDRLSFIKWVEPITIIIGSIILTIACERQEAPKPGLSRVVKVAAKNDQGDALAGFCDVIPSEGQKQPFQFPELDSTQDMSKEKTRWINIWATWCKPCIEEIPILKKWKEQLEKRGLSFHLTFLSVDATDKEMKAFIQQYPLLSNSLRMKDPEALSSLIKKLGLDPGAGLPIHVFLDQTGDIQCVRAAAINQNHFSTVTQMLKNE